MAEFARGRVCRGRLCQGPSLSGAEFVRGQEWGWSRKLTSSGCILVLGILSCVTWDFLAFFGPVLVRRFYQIQFVC